MLEQSSTSAPPETYGGTGRRQNQITDGIIKDMFGDGYSFEVLRGYMLHDAPRKAEMYVQDGEDDIKPYDGPRPGGAEECPNIPVLVRERRRANAIDHLPRIEGKAVGDKARWAQSMCYIVKNKDRRGKFEVDKARKLGVNPPDFKKLANNEEVRAKDGSIVTPDMVLAPPRKGHGFAVISIPTERWIEQLSRAARVVQPGNHGWDRGNVLDEICPSPQRPAHRRIQAAILLHQAHPARPRDRPESHRHGGAGHAARPAQQNRSISFRRPGIRQ